MDDFVLEVQNAKAVGFPVGGKTQLRFLVRSGSTALIRGSGADRDRKLPSKVQDLVDKGILQPHAKNNSLLVFVSDYLFSSPTAAGDVINGANLSAPEKWVHTGNGQSLKEWLK